MEYGLPDQLADNYGSSDAPAVKMPGTPRIVQNSQSGYGALPSNPYSQYGKTMNIARPKTNPQQRNGYPLQEIEGYEMQMVNGVPNAAPFAIDQISPTPFNRGDYDPVYNVSGKPYNWSKAPTYQGYGNPLMDLYNSFMSQGVPAAPINGLSTAEQRMALGTALQYIGLIPTATDDFQLLRPKLIELQQTAGIPASGDYDEATQTVVAQGYTAKRQGKAVEDIWKQAQAGGVLPAWWTTSVPATEQTDFTTDKKTNYVGIGAAIVGSGIVLYLLYKLVIAKKGDE
jgi:hypothetical protein